MSAALPDALWAHLSWWARTAPERVFAVSPAGPEATFTGLRRDARAMAAVWSSLGVTPGSRVHVQLGNIPEFLTCLFAASRLGAVMVPSHPSATADDVIYVMSHARCCLSVVTAGQASAVAAAAEMVPELTDVLSVDGPADGATDLRRLLDPERSVPTVPVDGRDLAAVLYTSGTTGWPKGVMITHANMLFAGRAVAELTRLRPEDRWLVTLPLSHANALLYSTMSAFVSGASVALMPRFDAAQWAASARRHQATLGSLFAVHARQLLALPDDGADAALRLTIFAQHLSEDERAALTARHRSRWMQVYGLTETLAPSLSDALFGPTDASSVGRPTSWVRTRLVDGAGREVPPGVPGQLQVGGIPGENLMAGYLDRPEDTATAMSGGWFSTGDEMRQLPDGSFAFLGRGEDILKPGVDNVSTAEIERVLLEHSSVAEAAVVGVQGRAGAEFIVAFVVLRGDDDATTQELMDWAFERLAEHKIPHVVVEIGELPRSAVGKVLKRQLHDRAQDAVGETAVVRSA